MSLWEGDPGPPASNFFAAAQLLHNWRPYTWSSPDNVVASKAWTSSVLPQTGQLRSCVFIAFDP